MKKELSIFGGIVCAFVCLILFLLQLIFIIFNSLKVVTTRNSINEIVKNVNMKELLIKNDDDKGLYKTFESLGFDKNETDSILSSNSFKEFISSFINNNIENIVNSTETKLEYDEIEKLVDNIEKEINIKFKGKQIFLKIVKENLSEIEKSMNISTYIKESVNPNILLVLKIVLSNTVNIIFIVLLVLIFLFMCLLRWSLYKPFIWYGITTAISSVILFLAFYGMNIIEVIKTSDINKPLLAIIIPIINVIRSKGMTISLIMLTIGVLMICIYTLINKKIINKPSELLEPSSSL